LLDLSLPDSFGTATVQSVVAAFPQIPVVVFTSSDDDELAIMLLEAGAQDYLVKGQFDRYALKRALRYASVRSRLEGNLRLFESALNSAADGVEITDSAGYIQWVNQAFLQMTGYTGAEVIGHTPGEVLKSGGHDQAFYQQMWATILSGNVWRGEVVNRRKDGRLYNEMLSIAPVIDATGVPRNYIAIKQDITERKRFEQRLVQSEQRLELALATSGLATWDLDIPSGNAVTDARWFEIMGYSPDDNLSNLASWAKMTARQPWRNSLPTSRGTCPAWNTNTVFATRMAIGYGYSLAERLSAGMLTAILRVSSAPILTLATSSTFGRMAPTCCAAFSRSFAMQESDPVNTVKPQEKSVMQRLHPSFLIGRCKYSSWLPPDAPLSKLPSV
jgi:PAS domain S-box-containing protein